ncbi:MAG: DUF4445 domain-containing protein [Anaerolineae bacterium]|nr:MAG: DUF4445 domain-containing protein [Anaerolineae bacterium]
MANPKPSDSSSFTCTFYPGGQTAHVKPDTSLSDAVAAAGLQMNLPCGGQGRCGRCKVIVQSGNVQRRAISRLSSTELEQGYALACQSYVTSDLTVFVPPQEEMIVRKLPSEKQTTRVIELPIECDWTAQQDLRQLHLVIDPPSLMDNTTDFDRLKRTLSKQHGVTNLRVDLPVMRKLARTLRDAGWDVTAVLEMRTWASNDLPRLLDILPGDQTDAPLYAVAVDIGTTSNVVYLVEMKSGQVLDTAIEYNRQISCGEDVISRIVYTRREGGLEHLQRLVIQTINGLIEEICQRQRIEPASIHRMTFAGNTTMIHLFLALWPEPIRREPFIPTVNHPLPVKAHELGLHVNPEATVDCLPGIGSYVGADITAGVLSSKMYATDKLTLFIDVGTNGEIVLGNSDWLISCACSAGPAFEGSGVHSGMRATVGAIEEVWINASTYEPTYRTIGDAPPQGICGSGIISLLAEMFVTGVLDKAGKINQDLDTPRIRRGEHGPEYVIAWKEETRRKQEDIIVTEVDTSNLLRAKAAIFAGFSVLVRSVGLQLADVEQVLIGGAFGKYIDVEKAIQIGLLPDMPWNRFHFLGNTSALGAYTALLCPDLRREVVEIANKMTYLELSADNTFYDEFTKALFLPHTDAAAFPSVARLLEGRSR